MSAVSTTANVYHPQSDPRYQEPQPYTNLQRVPSRPLPNMTMGGPYSGMGGTSRLYATGVGTPSGRDGIGIAGSNPYLGRDISAAQMTPTSGSRYSQPNPNHSLGAVQMNPGGQAMPQQANASFDPNDPANAALAGYMHDYKPPQDSGQRFPQPQAGDARTTPQGTANANRAVGAMGTMQPQQQPMQASQMSASQAQQGTSNVARAGGVMGSLNTAPFQRQY